MRRLRRHALSLIIVPFLLIPMATYAAGPSTPSTTTPTTTAAAATSPTATAAPAVTASAVPATSTPTASATPSPSPTLAPSPTVVPSPTVAPTDTPTDTTPPATQIPDDAFTVWHGVVREDGAYRRSGPTTNSDIEEELDPGTPVRIDQWVAGPAIYPDVVAWGQVDPEDGGGYIYGGSLAGVLPPAVPPVPAEMQGSTESWVDVNLTLNVVTAYQDGQPIKMILSSPGRPGDETDTGLFSVRTKLLSQEMVGPGYDVPNVPHVQYFYGAEALHGRYWTLPSVLGTTSVDVDGDGNVVDAADEDPIAGNGPNVGVAFGVPSSHGCVGVELDDAAWLYTFTSGGMTVDVHD